MTITAEGERGMERLCQAMWDAQETQLVGYAEDFEPFVRAVLLALREPSEGMVEAGEDCTDNYYSESGDFKRGWIAAIDSILSERTEGEG